MFNMDQIDAFFTGIKLARVGDLAERMHQQYQNYPDNPQDLDSWMEKRSRLDKELINQIGANEKYRIPK